MTGWSRLGFRGALLGVLLVGAFALVVPTGSAALVVAALGAPIVALVVIGLSDGSAHGFARATGSGVLGTVAALAAGYWTVSVLSRTTDWFDFPADSGGELWALILALFVAVPGFVAGSCCDARRGLALAGGFCGTVATAAAIPYLMAPQGTAPWGVLVLMAVGTLAGTGSAALCGRSISPLPCTRRIRPRPG